MLGSEQQYCHQEKHKTQIAAKIYNADANHRTLDSNQGQTKAYPMVDMAGT